MALRFWYQALTILTVIMPPYHFHTQWSNGIRVRICMMVPNLVPMVVAAWFHSKIGSNVHLFYHNVSKF